MSDSFDKITDKLWAFLFGTYDVHLPGRQIGRVSVPSIFSPGLLSSDKYIWGAKEDADWFILTKIKRNLRMLFPTDESKRINLVLEGEENTISGSDLKVIKELVDTYNDDVSKIKVGEVSIFDYIKDREDEGGSGISIFRKAFMVRLKPEIEETMKDEGIKTPDDILTYNLPIDYDVSLLSLDTFIKRKQIYGMKLLLQNKKSELIGLQSKLKNYEITLDEYKKLKEKVNSKIEEVFKFLNLDKGFKKIVNIKFGSGAEIKNIISTLKDKESINYSFAELDNKKLVDYLDEKQISSLRNIVEKGVYIPVGHFAVKGVKRTADYILKTLKLAAKKSFKASKIDQTNWTDEVEKGLLNLIYDDLAERVKIFEEKLSLFGELADVLNDYYAFIEKLSDYASILNAQKEKFVYLNPNILNIVDERWFRLLSLLYLFSHFSRFKDEPKKGDERLYYNKYILLELVKLFADINPDYVVFDKGYKYQDLKIKTDLPKNFNKETKKDFINYLLDTSGLLFFANKSIISFLPIEKIGLVEKEIIYKVVHYICYEYKDNTDNLGNLCREELDKSIDDSLIGPFRDIYTKSILDFVEILSTEDKDLDKFIYLQIMSLFKSYIIEKGINSDAVTFSENDFKAVKYIIGLNKIDNYISNIGVKVYPQISVWRGKVAMYTGYKLAEILRVNYESLFDELNSLLLTFCPYCNKAAGFNEGKCNNCKQTVDTEFLEQQAYFILTSKILEFNKKYYTFQAIKNNNNYTTLEDLQNFLFKKTGEYEKSSLKNIATFDQFVSFVKKDINKKLILNVNILNINNLVENINSFKGKKIDINKFFPFFRRAFEVYDATIYKSNIDSFIDDFFKLIAAVTYLDEMNKSDTFSKSMTYSIDDSLNSLDLDGYVSHRDYVLGVLRTFVLNVYNDYPEGESKINYAKSVKNVFGIVPTPKTGTTILPQPQFNGPPGLAENPLFSTTKPDLSKTGLPPPPPKHNDSSGNPPSPPSSPSIQRGSPQAAMELHNEVKDVMAKRRAKIEEAEKAAAKGGGI
ncbi:Uncharacterised protein [Candidatus Tiddalikarchaeum anstoanum]|nr:Uncharacterised protein [Candidatus Tiddalikarchaeum anstoanum]